MKLSELARQAREKSGQDDPDIRTVYDKGFCDITEVLCMDDYYDDVGWGKSIKEQKGDFVTIDSDWWG